MIFWILVVLFVVFTIGCRKKSRGRLGMIGFPILKDLPILLWHSYHNTTLEFNERRFDIYGDTIFSHAAAPTVCTRDADVAHAVFSDIEGFVRRTEKSKERRSHRFIHQFFGDGIFVADGELWREQRNFSSPLFRKNSLDQMIEVFEKNGHLFLDQMEDTFKSGATIDLQDYFNNYTMDSFGEIGFGVIFNSMTADNDFVRSFDRAQARLVALNLNPYYWFFDDKEYNDVINFLHNYTDEIISQRKKIPMRELCEKNDILSRFISKQDSSNFSDAFLRDLVMNFVVAGKDTTAQLLTWMVYNLLQYPSMLEKLLEEVDQFEGTYTREKINSLHYLDRFMHETLRLYPSVPRPFRTATADIKLPDGSMIYKDETISINVYCIHRNEKYWDNPNEFNPDRWIESPLKHPAQYMPFYGGPMVCLGKHLAIAEAKTLLIMLLKQYTFTLEQPVTLRMTLLLKCKSGLQVTVQKRSHT